MNRLVLVLLGIYRLVVKTGFMQTRIGQALFSRIYMVYKRLVEARHSAALMRYIPPGSCVIDVGANIGFFTLQFARQVGSDGHVFAIEPESHNFNQLLNELQRAGLAGRVTSLQAVAADSAGARHLQLDPYHPANHKIGSQGVVVTAITLDALSATRAQPVSFIKIDVQGAEMQVLDGGWKLISQQHPALFIECDDSALQGFGSSAAALIRRMHDAGYRIHEVGPAGISAELTPQQALAQQVAGGYTDFLFL